MKRRLRGYIFFIFCLVFAFPIMGRADESHNVENGNINITTEGNYKIIGSTTSNKVIVNAPGKEVDITIYNLKIDVSENRICAFEIKAGIVNLTLEGVNEF